MIPLRLMRALLFACAMGAACVVHSADKSPSPGTRHASTADVTTHKVDGPIDHNHCTTRQFQHMSFQHEGVWFVFYSDGKDFRYQTSADFGRTWKRADQSVAPAPNGSSSFDVLQVGGTVYVCHARYPRGRYDVNAPYAKDPARRGEYTHEGRIKQGRIEGRQIQWSLDVNPDFTPDYCNLLQDSNGYLWVFTREQQVGTAHRSREPDDIQTWETDSVCLPVKGRHALDAAALDEGRLYVVSVLTTDGRLYGNLYDERNWGDRPVLIADDMTTVAGDDRRAAVQFDRTRKRLHLIYVDADNCLRYRHLDSPYHASDWQPALSAPGTKLRSGVFTAALSVDSSSSPYQLLITYGVQKHLGGDKRRRTGELRARRFDGQTWQGDSVLVSQPGTIHNWYPNVNQDVKNGLCVLFSQSIDKENLGTPLAVMISLVADVR